MAQAFSTTDPPALRANYAQPGTSYASVASGQRAPMPNYQGPRSNYDPSRPTNQRESLSAKMEYERNTTEGLQTMTLYAPLPATKYNRISTVVLHVLNVLNLPNVTPMSRSYPIYHVHNEGERLGVSLTTINNTTKLLHRPIVIDGIALAWTYVDGSIPIPITICNAPRCPKDQLVAAFRAYGRLLHLEKLCAPNAPHTGNWSAILILKPEAECPTSIVFRQSNTPMKIIPFTNAEMCPTCYHADPSACVCPAPACHPAHIRHVPDEQAQASPPTNAMPTNPTTSAPAPDLVSFSNIPPVDEMAITAPAIPVSDNTMDVDNQASVAPAHNTGSPDATQAVSSDNASQPNATTVPSTSIRSDQLSTNNHPHRKTTSHNTPLDKHVGHATPLAKRGSDQAITPSNEGYHGTPKKMVAMGKDRPKTATSTMLRNRPPSLAISLSSLVQGQTIEPSSPLHTPNNDKSKAPANHIDIATQSPTHAYNAQSGATHSEPRMDSDNSLSSSIDDLPSLLTKVKEKPATALPPLPSYATSLHLRKGSRIAPTKPKNYSCSSSAADDSTPRQNLSRKSNPAPNSPRLSRSRSLSSNPINTIPVVVAAAALKANPIQTKPNTSYNNPLERPETGSTQE